MFLAEGQQVQRPGGRRGTGRNPGSGVQLHLLVNYDKSLLSFGKWDRDRCHSGEEVRREDSESTAFWKFIMILSYIFFF